MKALKFGSKQVQDLIDGKIDQTWRINDDKDLSVDDEVEFLDKKTGKAFGQAVIDRVTVVRYGDIGTDYLEVLKELQSFYGKEIDPKVHVKVITFTFQPYAHLVDLDERGFELKIPEMKLFADGGSRGNPGPSASGFVLMDMEDKVIKKSGEYLGVTTNNHAEYYALKLGLEEALKFGGETIDVYMDSMLVVNQMRGVYKVKNQELLAVHMAIKHLLTMFKHVSFTHIPRELNKLADAEVNETLDAVEDGR